MRIYILFLFSIFFLTGCSIEPEKIENDRTEEIGVQEQLLTGTFSLQAEPGYISAKNDRDAEIYIIDMNNDEVYVQGKGKAYTAEDLERLDEMTAEEKSDFFDSQEVEDSLHEIKALKATKDLIVLEYDDEIVEFTALSDSFFETDTGVRYRFEENASIPTYEEISIGE